MFSKTKAIEEWKNGNWPALLEWFGDFDLMRIVEVGLQLPRLLSLDLDDKIQEFEFILALLLAEYSIGLQHLLHSDDLNANDPSFNSYEQSLLKIKAFLDFLYFEFISTI
jgi:hypothetical protein